MTPDEPTGNNEEPEDSSSEPEEAIDGLMLPTIISPLGGALVRAEEDHWAALYTLKAANPSLERREGLKNEYISLAAHYSSLGSHEGAARFLRNALAQVKDARVQHALGREQGRANGVDFIVSFQDLLKQQPYNLSLALEFCYFLEMRNFHEAALDVAERELKKRPVMSEGSLPAETKLIFSFLNMMRVSSAGAQHSRVQDYEALFRGYFPAEEMGSLAAAQEKSSFTAIGQELEEFDAEHGIKEEIAHYTKLCAFLARAYPVQMLIGLSVLILVGMAALRASDSTILLAGNTLTALLILFLTYEFARSFRLSGTFRDRAHRRVANGAVAASFAVIVLAFAGPRMTQSGQFVSPFLTRAISIILVSSVLWRTYLSAELIQRTLVDVGAEIVQTFKRRGYRRQIASIVSGTSKWTLFITCGVGLDLLSRGGWEIAVAVLMQGLLLAVCWRWGYLETNAEKQALRDFLALLIGVLFTGIIAVLSISGHSFFEVVVALSLDGSIVLGVMVTYLLQIPAVGRRVLIAFCIGFLSLNLVPLLGAEAITSILRRDWTLPDVSRVAWLFQVGLLVFAIWYVRRIRLAHVQRVNVHTENYMAKYQITGGVQGAVGDGSQATHFTQLWNERKSEVDLDALAHELAALRPKLAAAADQPSHFRALGDVSAAEQAARASDGASAIEKLRSAGDWFWDTAQKVGIGVATAGVKHMLGI